MISKRMNNPKIGVFQTENGLGTGSQEIILDENYRYVKLEVGEDSDKENSLIIKPLNVQLPSLCFVSFLSIKSSAVSVSCILQSPFVPQEVTRASCHCPELMKYILFTLVHLPCLIPLPRHVSSYLFCITSESNTIELQPMYSPKAAPSNLATHTTILPKACLPCKLL